MTDFALVSWLHNSSPHDSSQGHILFRMVHHDALVVLISRTTRMTCSADSDGRVAVDGYQSINLAKAVEDLCEDKGGTNRDGNENGNG